MDSLSDRVMQLEQEAAAIDNRLGAISAAITRLCLRGEPGGSAADDLSARVQALHAERDTLNARLAEIQRQRAALDADSPNEDPDPRRTAQPFAAFSGGEVTWTL